MSSRGDERRDGGFSASTQSALHGRDAAAEAATAAACVDELLNGYGCGRAFALTTPLNAGARARARVRAPRAPTPLCSPSDGPLRGVTMRAR